LYHFHDPELIPMALLLKLRGKKVIYDVHENVPAQIMSKPWVPVLLRRPIAAGISLLERLAVACFDGVVAAYESITRRLQGPFVTVINNYAIPGELVDCNPRPYQGRPNVVTYIGGLTAIRGTREMVDAMTLLPQELEAKLVLGGSFSPAEHEAEIRARPGWKHVEYKGWQSRAQMGETLSESRIGLMCFHPEPNHVEAQPNKLFEYMSAGIPVVASDFAYWRNIVDSVECGLLVDPLDPAAIAAAVKWLLEHPEEAARMGERGREAVRNRFTWTTEAQSLLTLYQYVITR
jgi:glycosyltransferase involved in cell wall biosynthesis